MGIKLVVGLGNPGPKYDGTRHNIGRRVVEQLKASSLGAATLVPDSFMNESGHDVCRVARKKGIEPQETLIVVDEFQVPLGFLKLLKNGSGGGHNGLQSVVECLGTPDVPRLRIGIGPLPPDMDPAEFVLKRFSALEEQKLKVFIPEYMNAITLAVQQGLDTAMNKFNNRSL